MYNKNIATKGLLLLICLIFVGRLTMSYIPDINKILERYVYKTRVSEFQDASKQDAVNSLEQVTEGTKIFYIGRAG